MKYTGLYALILVFVCTGFKEQNTVLPTDLIKSVNSSEGLTSMTANRANFSGNWKLNKSVSETGQFGVGDKVCLDWLAASVTLKIAAHEDFLTVDIVSPPLDGEVITTQEKLAFNGKETEGNFLGHLKKSTVKWTDDGKTMNVNSVIYYFQRKIKISEVWKLINGGKSISLVARSNSVFGENVMKLVYDKVN
jgi:hypothetical protein